MRPRAIVVLDPCLSLEDLVGVSINGLRAYYLTILTEVLDRSSFWNNVVIGFEGKLDLLLPLVQVKVEVEM
jgi:hypothetical protein